MSHRMNANVSVDGSLSVDGVIRTGGNIVGSNNVTYAVTTTPDQTAVSAEADITGLTGLNFPTTPDAVKKYRVDAVVNYSAGTADGDSSLYLNAGATGDMGDALLHTCYGSQARGPRTGQVVISGLHITPSAAQAKFGLSIAFSAGAYTINGTSTVVSYIRVEDISSATIGSGT